MINISTGKLLPLYTKDTIILSNIKDSIIEKFGDGRLKKRKPYMEFKINDQLKDFSYNSDNVDGRIFRYNSASVKRTNESEEFKNILIKHKQEIQNGERFSDSFEKNINLHNAYGKVDFLNSGIDNQGNLHLYMFDTYDFNKGENVLIEAARRKIVRGELKPFFTIHEIILSQKELKEILSY